jgi:hypothetical protein
MIVKNSIILNNITSSCNVDKPITQIKTSHIYKSTYLLSHLNQSFLLFVFFNKKKEKMKEMGEKKKNRNEGEG